MKLIPTLLVVCSTGLIPGLMAQSNSHARVSIAQQLEYLDARDQRLENEINQVERRVGVLEGHRTCATPVPQNTEYVVQSGDTLTRIARKLGLSVEEVRRVNGGSNALYVNQVLNFTNLNSLGIYEMNNEKANGYSQSYSPNVDQNVNNSSSHQVVEYRVRRGDTVSKIARTHGLSMADISRWNGLSNMNQLRVGQILRLSSDSTSYTAVNNTNTNQPSWRSPVQVERKFLKKSRNERAPHGSYQVRRGDTLSKIARANGISMSELAKINNLSNWNSLRVGQVLKVPGHVANRSDRATSNQTDYRDNRTEQVKYEGSLLSYRVLADDTLETISQTFMTSSDEIASLNGLRRNERPATGSVIQVPLEPYLRSIGYQS